MAKRKKTETKKKEPVKSRIKTWMWQYQNELGVYTLLIILVLAILYIFVVLPDGEKPVGMSRDCCEQWCEKGNLECHIYTSEQIKCKYPEDEATEGATPVITFHVYDISKTCSEQITGVTETAENTEGVVSGEVSIS